MLTISAALYSSACSKLYRGQACGDTQVNVTCEMIQLCQYLFAAAAAAAADACVGWCSSGDCWRTLLGRPRAGGAATCSRCNTPSARFTAERLWPSSFQHGRHHCLDLLHLAQLHFFDHNSSLCLTAPLLSLAYTGRGGSKRTGTPEAPLPSLHCRPAGWGLSLTPIRRRRPIQRRRAGRATVQ